MAEQSKGTGAGTGTGDTSPDTSRWDRPDTDTSWRRVHGPQIDDRTPMGAIDDETMEAAAGSYQPLADELHKSEPPPKPILEPGDMVMRSFVPESRADRIKRIVDKTIRSMNADERIGPGAEEALLTGRYSQWLDENLPKVAPAAPAHKPGGPAP